MTSELVITDISPKEGAAIMAEVRAAYPDATLIFGPGYRDTLDSLTAERDELRDRLAKAERLNAMLPDELTRLADLLEAKVPVPSNRTYYEEGWLDAVRAVTAELRSMRAALSEGGSK